MQLRLRVKRAELSREQPVSEKTVEITVPNTRYVVTTSPAFPGRSCVTVALTRDELERALEAMNKLERK
jgi:hypothetical protein